MIALISKRSLTMKSRQLNKHTSLALAAFVASMFVVCSAAAQFNQEVMMKWADAKVVRYSVVGDYEGEDLVVNAGTSGLAIVKDHVEITFDYDVTTAQLVGTPVIKDSVTEMGVLRNGADGCRPPTISGVYEHSTIESLTQENSAQLTMMVRTDYPAAQMTVACTGGNQPVTAHSETSQEEFLVPGIMMLAMADALTGDALRVSSDGNAFIVKRDGWTYIYTPSKVP